MGNPYKATNVQARVLKNARMWVNNWERQWNDCKGKRCLCARGTRILKRQRDFVRFGKNAMWHWE